MSAPERAARDWRLIGRAGELERVAGARAAGVPGVVLAAGAGVGKSRLARAALTAAQQAGAVTVWIQATRSAASVPLGAFASVIPAGVRSDDLFELLRGAGAALGELAGMRPLVVGVDDAQLLDPVSAALVLHLTSATDAFVLATVRTGEPCPDAIVSLWKDAGAQRLELAQLDKAQTAELVESIVGGGAQMNVAWSGDPNSSVGVTYTILRSANGGAYSVAGTVLDSYSFVDGGLNPGTAYSYEVTAATYAGASGASSPGSGTTLTSAQDMPFSGLVLWLRADAGVEPDYNGKFAQWQDQSGLNNNTIQGISGLARNAVNGRPAATSSISFSCSLISCRAPKQERSSLSSRAAGEWGVSAELQVSTET